MVEKEKVIEDKVAVVMELPTQAFNKVKTEAGESITLITLTDAITEMYNDIKDIKKAIK